GDSGERSRRGDRNQGAPRRRRRPLLPKTAPGRARGADPPASCPGRAGGVARSPTGRFATRSALARTCASPLGVDREEGGYHRGCHLCWGHCPRPLLRDTEVAVSPHPMMDGGLGGRSFLRSMRVGAELGKRQITRGTARRVLAFARPYRWEIL